MKWNKTLLIKRAQTAAFVYALIGGGLFLSSFVCVLISISGKQMLSTWARLPLGELEGVAVDSEGRIYCGLSGYARIQVYSADGDFSRGWFFEARDKMFRLKIDENDLLHVYPVAGLNYCTYDSEGKILSKVLMSAQEEDKVFEGSYPWLDAEDPFGNRYEIRNRFSFPKVVKITPEGKERVVIRDPVYLWFLGSPLPAWYHIAVGLTASIYLERLEHRRKKTKAKV